MPRRMIAKLGQPVLLQKAAAIEEPTADNIQMLIDDMIETLVEAQGVGLAAPQIFEPVRLLLAIDIARDDADSSLWTLINPSFVAIGDDIAFDIEACLSIDGIAGIVPRHRKIRVQALDREGKTVDFIAEGHFARVIQHEIDHLEGILYPMRVRDWRALSASSERRHLRKLLEDGYDRS